MLARRMCGVAEGSDNTAKLGMLLESHEEPTTSSEEERRHRAAALAQVDTIAKREVDRVAREYFVRVWHRRGRGPLTRQSGIQDGVGSVAPGW